MADLTSVGVASGVPSSGTGTVATINQLIVVGSPISNGSTSAPVIAGLVGPSSTVTSSMTGLVAAISYISSAVTIQSVASISSIASIGSLSSGTVFVSSGSLATVGTINSISSGTIALSSNSPGIIQTGTAGSPSSVFLSVQGTSNATPIPINVFPATSGGLTLSSFIMSSGTNSTLVSSSPRQLYKVECFNNSANIGYLHTYNLSSAPTAGSSLVFDRFLVPGNAAGAGVITTTDIGIPYTTGLSYTFTGGIADSDTTAVAASAFIVNLYYK